MKGDGTQIDELRGERDLINVLLDPRLLNADQPRSLLRRRAAVQDAIEDLESQGDGGPRLTVTLDAYASAIVRRVMVGEPDALAEDVVNAALVFNHGESDDHDSQEELLCAIERRLARGGKEAE